MKLQEFKKLTVDEKLAFVVSFVEHHTRCTGQSEAERAFIYRIADAGIEVNFDFIGTPKCEWTIHFGDHYSYTFKDYKAAIISAQFYHACIPVRIDEQELFDLLHWKPTL